MPGRPRSETTTSGAAAGLPAIASALVAVLQQFANFYLGGTGDFVVVLLLAAVLLVKPTGLLGSKA
jgi:branched-chain amino acid transport system permease protein